MSFEVQWRKTGGAWQPGATVRRSKARVTDLDAGGAYAFRVRAFGGDWSARLAAPAAPRAAADIDIYRRGPVPPTSAAEESAMVERALALAAAAAAEEEAMVERALAGPRGATPRVTHLMFSGTERSCH